MALGSRHTQAHDRKAWQMESAEPERPLKGLPNPYPGFGGDSVGRCKEAPSAHRQAMGCAKTLVAEIVNTAGGLRG